MSEADLRAHLNRARADFGRLRECRIEGATWLEGLTHEAAGAVRAERDALNRHKLVEFIRENAEKIAGMAASEARTEGEGVEVTSLRLAFGPPPRNVPRGDVTTASTKVSP